LGARERGRGRAERSDAVKRVRKAVAWAVVIEKPA
jgi:hypothetical protein